MTLDSLGDDYVIKSARDIETVSYWNFQADRKDPKAFYELGRIHQLGLHGIKKDIYIAADFYEKACLYDHPGALGELGRLYTLGHGRELNYNTALKYLERGVELLDSNSLVTIGSLIFRNIYTSDDLNKPLDYIRKSALLNNVESEYELALYESREGRINNILLHLNKAREGGHIKAMMAVAQLYDNGLGGLKQSCDDAVQLYKQVCESGPWVDLNGPRNVLKEFRKGRESSALMIGSYIFSFVVLTLLHYYCCLVVINIFL